MHHINLKLKKYKTQVIGAAVRLFIDAPQRG